VTEYEIIVYFETDISSAVFDMPTLVGCTDPAALNYDPDANEDSGACIEIVVGCHDATSFNYDPESTFNDQEICLGKAYGCTFKNATNHDAEANVEDGSCWYAYGGCTDPAADNWNVAANVDDGSCIIANVWIDGDANPWVVAPDEEECTMSPGTTAEENSTATTCELMPADTDMDPPVAGSCAVATGSGSCEYVPSPAGRRRLAQSLPDGVDFVVTVALKSVDHPSNGEGSEFAYRMNGEEGVVLELTRGKTYVFDANWAPGTHPFYITLDAAGGGGGGVTAGVDNSLVSGDGRLMFTPGYDLPDEIYYGCYFHHFMGGVIQLTFDERNYPAPVPPEEYPTCLETCWASDIEEGCTMTPGTTEEEVAAVSTCELTAADTGVDPPVAGSCTIATGSGRCEYIPPAVGAAGAMAISSDPTSRRIPDWYNYAAACNWLASAFLGCEVDTERCNMTPGTTEEEANATTTCELMLADTGADPPVAGSCAVATGSGSCEYIPTTLQFNYVKGCENSCMNECADEIIVFAFGKLASCPFGCDTDARTGSTERDRCGICGGDGSFCQGCTDEQALNQAPDATVDDGSCVYRTGCMDPRAINYDAGALRPSGDCIYPSIEPCHPLVDPHTDCANSGFASSIATREVSNRICMEQLRNGDRTVCTRYDFYADVDLHVETTGCPDHTYMQTTNCLSAMAQQYKFSIPKNPSFSSDNANPTWPVPPVKEGCIMTPHTERCSMSLGTTEEEGAVATTCELMAAAADAEGCRMTPGLTEDDEEGCSMTPGTTEQEDTAATTCELTPADTDVDPPVAGSCTVETGSGICAYVAEGTAATTCKLTTTHADADAAVAGSCAIVTGSGSCEYIPPVVGSCAVATGSGRCDYVAEDTVATSCELVAATADGCVMTPGRAEDEGTAATTCKLTVTHADADAPVARSCAVVTGSGSCGYIPPVVGSCAVATGSGSCDYVAPAAGHAIADSPVGVAVNGVPFFNGELNFEDASFAIGPEECQGHTDAASQYQYRQTPLCILEKLGGSLLSKNLWDSQDVCPCGTTAGNGEYDVSRVNLHGAMVSSSLDGHTGRGFVQFSGASSNMTVALRSCTSGAYTMLVRYASATLPSSVDTYMTLQVNGVVYEEALLFPATAQGKPWAGLTTDIHVEDGENMITLGTITPSSATCTPKDGVDSQADIAACADVIDAGLATATDCEAVQHAAVMEGCTMTPGTTEEEDTAATTCEMTPVEVNAAPPVEGSCAVATGSGRCEYVVPAASNRAACDYTAAVPGAPSPLLDHITIENGCPACGSDAVANVRHRDNWPMSGTPSPLVGWALDGFAIYGPYDEHGNLTYPDSIGGGLDECNGRVGADGRYRYHSSPLATNTISCFRGAPGTVENLGPTDVACDGRGTGIEYKIGRYADRQCNPECVPACLKSCVDEWAWSRPATEATSGLLSDGWAGVPVAPRIYRVSGSGTEYTMKNLDACTKYSVKISAVNAVGKSTESLPIQDTTDCPPQQPSTVKPLAVTSTGVTLAWDHAVTATGSPILEYRLFVSQLSNRTAIGGIYTPSRWIALRPSDEYGSFGSSQYQYMFRTNESERLTNPANPAWNIVSKYWTEIRVPPLPGTTNPWSPSAAMEMTVTALLPAQAYKFRVTAINAAGESFASYDSAIVKTNDAAITQIQIFAGHPCITNDKTRTPFHAISDGTNVKYQWRTSWGGRAGSCVSDDCSAMYHSFSTAGRFQIIVYASNSRGFRGQLVTLDVRPCGCTDSFNPNYWFAAMHAVPEKCEGWSWDEVEKSMTRGETKLFSFPISEKSFGAEIHLRVDLGAVDMFVSTTGIPDWRMVNTYIRSGINVSNFKKVSLEYGDLYDVLKYDATEKVFIAVMAKSDYARFGLHAHRSDFNQGSFGLAVRRNLDRLYEQLQLYSGYYDFWEYYLPQAVHQDSVDVTVTFKIYLGCITVYASKYERYPSPLRAHGASYGHDAAVSAHGCSGTADDDFSMTISFNNGEPRVLYLSTYGGKVYIKGNRPPVNSYSISAESTAVVHVDAVSQIRAQYAGIAEVAGSADGADVASGADAAPCEDDDCAVPEPEPEVSRESSDDELHGAAGVHADVHNMGWRFYEVVCSQYATAIEIQVEVKSGEVVVYKNTGSEPRKGSYELKVLDDNDDNSIAFSLPFNEIGAKGKFYLGIYGKGAGIYFDLDTYTRTNGFVLKAIDVGFDCVGDYFECQGDIRALADEETLNDIITDAKYKYFVIDLAEFLASEKFDNSTMTFGETATQNMFAWTAPLSPDYVSAQFQKRTVNALFNVSISKMVSMDPTQPVTCMLFGSTVDPFPGHTRTYDVWLEHTFEDATGSDSVIHYASVELPIFSFSPLKVHFSVTCDESVAYVTSVTLTQFDRSSMITTDTLSPYRPCPGEVVSGGLLQWRADEGGLSCNGHGACVDEGIYGELYTSGWSTAAPVCYCNVGWVGHDCSIERFPEIPFIRILSPQPGETLDPEACAPCVPIVYRIEVRPCPWHVACARGPCPCPSYRALRCRTTLAPRTRLPPNWTTSSVRTAQTSTGSHGGPTVKCTTSRR
jgi:hypothetical protein